MIGGFVVVENTPGYLPESEPIEFADMREAESYAKSLLSELSEDGYQVVAESAGYWLTVRDDNELGRVVEILVSEE